MKGKASLTAIYHPVEKKNSLVCTVLSFDKMESASIIIGRMVL
jgi:hypothetical protein